MPEETIDSGSNTPPISNESDGVLVIDPKDVSEKLEVGKSKLHKLIPSVKDYAWGIRGMDSRVGRFALESGAIDKIDHDTPYAELWIGTHPKGPSTLEDGRTLQEACGKELPFLFKVLSAGKALSIQAHPDKDLATRLHESNPNAYGDSNHKPEMAIALTPFEAMCGFRRLEEIAVLLQKHEEFANCISESAKLQVFLAKDELSQQKALRALFESFMNCPKEKSNKELQLLLLRLQAEQSNLHPHPHDSPPWERKCARAILRLSQQFPNDAGAMAPLFLNYLLMAPGESFFMAANEPHAYVAGEIIECMACSDNVVRAGLTPKFKDVDNLVHMLTYTMGGPSIDAGAPLAEDTRILRYTPPVPEFEVLMLNCDPGESIHLNVRSCPAVLVVIEGTGMIDGKDTCQPGQSYFHEAHSAPVAFSVPSTCRGPLKVAVAHQNLHLQLPTTFNKSSCDTSLANSLHSTRPTTPYRNSPGGRAKMDTFDSFGQNVDYLAVPPM